MTGASIAGMMAADRPKELDDPAVLACLVVDADLDEIATVLGKNVQDAVAWLQTHGPELARLEARARAEGKAARPIAERIEDRALRRILSKIDEVDVFSAAELLKVAQRTIERDDKKQAAKKDKYADLPIIHMTIAVNGAVTTEIRPSAAADVVDVAPVEPVEELFPDTRGEPDLADTMLALAAGATAAPIVSEEGEN